MKFDPTKSTACLRSFHVFSLLRSLHTLENFGCFYYNDCVAFKTSSLTFY